MRRLPCGSTGARALVCGAALALWLGTAARPALAFCRTSSCGDCPRDAPSGCTIGGSPIAWPDVCVSFSMSRVTLDSLDRDSATALMAQAFATWEAARCGSAAAPPSIRVTAAFGGARCTRAEFNPRGKNANLVVFRAEGWPYTSPGNALAATTLTFDADGLIHDADIELNAATETLVPPEPPTTAEDVVSYGVVAGGYDLASILLHEAGHFLGLDHSREENSVMAAELPPSVVRTQLSPDDIAAICSVYPPERAVSACDPTPYGGFSADCDASALTGGCSLLPQSRALQPALFGALVFGWGLVRWARRREVAGR